MTVKQQYKKQRRRAQSLIRKYKKAGYEVEIEIPKIPKRITKGSINRLAKITPEKVRRASYAPNPLTGERVNFYSFKDISKKLDKTIKSPYDLYSSFITAPVAPENVSRETFLDNLPPDVSRETSAPTPYWEDVVIENFKEAIENMQSDKLSEIAFNWLERNISTHGKTKVAEMLNDGAEKGIFNKLEVVYKESDVLVILTDLTQLMDISAAEKNEVMKYYYENGDIFEEYY